MIEESKELTTPTPTPEKPTPQTIKITTYVPDEKHIQKVQSIQKLNQIDDQLLELPNLESSSVEEILEKLQKSNHLPATITPDNIDGSIKTLVKILNNLKKNQILQQPPTPVHSNHASEDYDYGSDEDGKLAS